MDAHRFALLLTLALGVSLSGCRSDPYMDAYFDTVNAEKRALEDTIYDLKYENDKLREKLEKFETGVGVGGPIDTGDGGYGPLVTPPGAGSQTPSIDPPTNPDLSDPKTKPGVEADPKEIFPKKDNTDASFDFSHPESIIVDAGPVGTSVATPMADANAEVTHLHINRAATRGRNTDGQPGDDLLVIGLEPRDRYGRFVPAPSQVSLVLLDPDLQGQAARVAQWSFDATTVAEGAQNAAVQPMILLEAAWPKRPPTNSRLQLWARYTTRDGRILQTRETIHITPPGDLSARWTPRTERARTRVADRTDEATAPAWRPNR